MLEKTTREVTFQRGLELKRNSRLIPGRVLTLDDCEFDTADTIKKAQGFDVINPAVLGGGNLPAAAAMFPYRDELLQAANSAHELHSYSSITDKWVSKGPATLYTVGSKQIVRNNRTQTAFDAAQLGSVSVWVWQDTLGGIHASVFDEATGVAHQVDQVLSATGQLPRVVVATGKICVVYIEGVNVKLTSLTPATPNTFAAAVNVRTDATIGVNARMDACPQNGAIVISYKESAGNTINTVVCSNAGVVSAGPVNLAQIPSYLHVQCFASNEVAVFWTGATNLDVTTYTSALVLRGAVQVEATAVAVVNVTSTPNGSNLRIVYELTGASSSTHLVKHAEISVTPTVTTAASVLARGVGLASQAFSFSGAIHVGAVFDTTQQPTFFLLGVTGTIAGMVMGRAVVWRSAGLNSSLRLPGVFTGLVTGAVSLAIGEKGRLAFSKGKDITPKGVSRLDIFDVRSSWRSAVEYNDSLYIAASVPQLYDGAPAVEADFLLYPEAAASGDGGAGGLRLAGTYQFVYQYEWTDNRGRLHRSVATSPVSVVLAAGHKVSHSLPTLRLTQRKKDIRGSVTIAIFGTEANGSVFYRTTSPTTPPVVNDVTVDSLIYVDDLADTALIANEILPTMGGVLDNEPCPPCRGFAVHQDRLVAIGLEDEQSFAYSKKSELGEGAAGFNELLRGRCPPTRGRLAGAVSLDGKLILIAEKKPFLVFGEGPNKAGTNNNFSEPQELPVDFGVKYGSHRSVVVNELGAWWLSDRGIRVLGRDLSMVLSEDGKPLGAEVDTLATQVLSALLHASRAQIHFYTGTNVLVWDSTFRQWSRKTAHPCVDACQSKTFTSPTHVDSSGQPYKTMDLGQHGGDSFDPIVELAPLTFAGVNGFQRVWRIQLTGSFPGGTNLSLKRDDGIYDETVGLPSGSARLRHHLAKQKCASLGVQITGFDNLTNIALELGVKRGTLKLPASASG